MRIKRAKQSLAYLRSSHQLALEKVAHARTYAICMHPELAGRMLALLMLHCGSTE